MSHNLTDENDNMHLSENLLITETQDESLPPSETSIEKPITARITWDIAIALIRCIQFAAKHGQDENDQIARAVCFAQKLQHLLDPNSKEFQDIDLGWLEVVTDENTDENHEIWEDYIGEEPLDKFEDPEETRATYKTESHWFAPKEKITNE